MTDTDTTTTDEIQDEAVEEAPESGGPKELREYNKRLKAENAELRARISTDVYAEVGLDPSTGLGKAIAKEYKGALEAEELAKYAAEEYGWQAPTPPENVNEPAIEQNQPVIDQVNAVSTSQVPASHNEQLRKAQQEGDFETTRRLKAEQLERMLREQRR